MQNNRLFSIFDLLQAADFQTVEKTRVGEPFHLSEDCDEENARTKLSKIVGEPFHLSEDCDLYHQFARGNKRSASLSI